MKMIRLLKIAVGTFVVGVLICWLIVDTQIQDVRSTHKRDLESTSDQADPERPSVEELVRELPREKILKQRLGYLKDRDEVCWVEIEDNNVYIGFSTRPPDLTTILRAAAFRGNRAIDFGVHVWGAGCTKPGWRPGGRALWWQNVTARYGKIEPGSILIRHDRGR